MKDSWFDIYDKIEEVGVQILERLNILGVTEFELPQPLLYGFDKNDGVKTVNIVSVCFDMLCFDGSSVAHLIKLKLSNGDSEHISYIKLYQFGELQHIVLMLDSAIKEKQNTKTFHKIHVENKDIIITDPCYIMKKKEEPKHKYIDNREYDLIFKNKWKTSEMNISQCLEAYRKYKEGRKLQEQYDIEYYKELDDDWRKCEYGENMEAIGINNCIITNTLYGDWSCTTYNTDTKEEIGNFCADAGMVGVFELDEVLKYNPDFDYHINRKWTTTLIKNFTGDIWFERHHHEGVYEDDSDFHKKGEKWEEDTMHVIGKGNINFNTEQTGL